LDPCLLSIHWIQIWSCPSLPFGVDPHYLQGAMSFKRMLTSCSPHVGGSLASKYLPSSTLILVMNNSFLPSAPNVTFARLQVSSNFGGGYEAHNVAKRLRLRQFTSVIPRLLPIKRAMTAMCFSLSFFAKILSRFFESNRHGYRALEVPRYYTRSCSIHSIDSFII